MLPDTVAVGLPRRSLTAAERSRVLKPKDAWWTVIAIDPVAIRVLPWLRDVRWVTPTRITMLSGVVGVLALLAFAAGAVIAGGVLYELRFLLDCLDGKLARLRGTSSRLGALLDVLLDVTLTTSAYAVVAAAAAPALATPIVGLALLEAWARERRAAAASGRVAAAPAGDRPWHRLVIAPSTVDVEALVLFIVPVVAWRAERFALWLAVGMLALVCLDHLRVVVTAAARSVPPADV